MSALPQLADLDKLASELAENPLKYAAQAEKHNWDFHLNIDLDAAANRFQSIPHAASDNKYPLTNLDQLYNMYRRVDQGLAPIETPSERQKSLVLNGLEIRYAKPPGLLESDSEVTQSSSESEQWPDDTPRRQSGVDPDVLRRQSTQALAPSPTIDISHHGPGQLPQSPKSNLVAAQTPSALSSKQTISRQDPLPCETLSTEKLHDLPHLVGNDPEAHTTPPATPLQFLTTDPQPTHHLPLDADLTIENPSLLAANQSQSTSAAPPKVPSPVLNRPTDQSAPAQPRGQLGWVTRSSHLFRSEANGRRASMPARIPSRPQFIVTSRHAKRQDTRFVPPPADAYTNSKARENSIQLCKSTADAREDTAAGPDICENVVPQNTPSVDVEPSTGAAASLLNVSNTQDVSSSRRIVPYTTPSIGTGDGAGHATSLVNVNNPQNLTSSPRILQQNTTSVDAEHGIGATTSLLKGKYAHDVISSRRSVPQSTPSVDAKPGTEAATSSFNIRNALNVTSSRRGLQQQEGSNGVARDDRDEEPDSCVDGTGDVIRESTQIETRAQPPLFDYPPTISPSPRRVSRLTGISVRTPRRFSTNIGLQTQLKKDDVSPDPSELRDARRRSSVGLIDRRKSVAGVSPPLGLTNAVRAPNGVYECVVEGKQFQLVVEVFHEAEEGMKGVQCSPAEIDADMDILFAPLFVEPEPIVEKKRKIDVAIQFTGVEDSPDRQETPKDSGPRGAETQSVAAHSDGDVPPKKLQFSQNEMPKEANLSEIRGSQREPSSKEVVSPAAQDDAQSIRKSKRNYPRYSGRSAQIKSKRQSYFKENLEGKNPEESQDRTLRVSEGKISKPSSSKSSKGNRVSQRKREKAKTRTKSSQGIRRSKRLSNKQSSRPSVSERSGAKDMKACNKRMDNSISPETEKRGRKSVPFVVVVEPGDDDVVVEAVDDSGRNDILVSEQLREDESYSRAGRKHSRRATGGRVKEARHGDTNDQGGEGGCASAVLFDEDDDHDADVECEDDDVPHMDEVEETPRIEEGNEIPQMDVGEGVSHVDDGEEFPLMGGQEKVPLMDADLDIPLMDDDDDIPPLARATLETAPILGERVEIGDEDFGEEGEDEGAHEVSIGEDEEDEAALRSSKQSADSAMPRNVARVLEADLIEEPQSKCTVMISGGLNVEPERAIEDARPKAAKKGGKRRRQGTARKEISKARKLTPNTLRQARSKREMKRLGLSNLPVPAEAVLSDDSDCEENQPRRSKRRKFPPLQYWKNEKKVYERRRSQLLPTVSQVVVAVEGGAEVESELSLEALKARRVVASRSSLLPQKRSLLRNCKGTPCLSRDIDGIGHQATFWPSPAPQRNDTSASPSRDGHKAHRVWEPTTVGKVNGALGVGGGVCGREC